VFQGDHACVFLKSHLFPGSVQNGSAHILQGNKDNKPLHSICWSWNERVNCLACVSDSCARVWSTDGQPVRELNQNGYFRSCSFHPKYENTLVLGGYEVLSIFCLGFLSIIMITLFLQNMISFG
jgi:WD40 repeat protein